MKARSARTNRAGCSSPRARSANCTYADAPSRGRVRARVGRRRPLPPSRSVSPRYPFEIIAVAVIECMPDTNIYDLIVKREGMVDALEHLRSSGRLELISIGEIEDELAKVSAASVRRGTERRRRARDSRRVRLDFGHLDGEPLGPGDNVRVRPRRSRQRQNSRQAIIAETAHKADLVLVTHDGRLSKRATDVGIPVLNFPAFVRLVELLATS